MSTRPTVAMAAALICGCCVLTLLGALTSSVSFVVASSGAGLRGARQNVEEVDKLIFQMPSGKADEALEPSQEVLAFSRLMCLYLAFVAATLLGLIIGLTSVPQSASAGGQPLQNLGTKSNPKATTWKQRMKILRDEEEETMREFRADYERIQAGLKADPKEKRVADAMELMRGNPPKEVARSDHLAVIRQAAI